MAVGVVVQVLAIVLESVRLTLTQLLLQRQGVKMNPITALYYVAPCCFVGLLPLVFAMEWDRMRASTLPLPIMHLFLNSLCAFGVPPPPSPPPAPPALYAYTWCHTVVHTARSQRAA